MSDKKQEKKAIEPTTEKPGNLMGFDQLPEHAQQLKKIMKNAKAQAVANIKERGIKDGKIIVGESGYQFQFEVKGGEVQEATVTPILAGTTLESAMPGVAKALDEVADTIKKTGELIEIAMSDSDVRGVLANAAKERAEFWSKRPSMATTNLLLDDKNWREELGEDAMLIPPCTAAFLSLPKEVQITTIDNMLSCNWNAVTSRDNRALFSLSGNTERIKSGKFLTIEHAVASLSSGHQYDYPVLINSVKLMSGMSALADVIFRRNNAALQYGDKIVIPQDTELRLMPYHILAKALLEWSELTASSQKDGTDFAKKFVTYIEPLKQVSIDSINKVEKIMSIKVLKAICRNWHHYVSEDDSPMAFGDYLAHGGDVFHPSDYPGMSSAKAGLHDHLATHEMLVPLNNIQRRMVSGEMKEERENLCISLIRLVMKISQISLTNDDGIGLIGNHNLRTMRRSYNAVNQNAPDIKTVYEIESPYEPIVSRGFRGMHDDKQPVTEDNFNVWSKDMLDHIERCLDLRRTMFTKRDHRMYARLSRDDKTNVRTAPDTPAMMHITAGGVLQSKRALRDLVESTDVHRGMNTWLLQQAGLNWSGLLMQISQAINNDAREANHSMYSSNFSHYGDGSMTPIPVNSSISSLITKWNQLCMLQREYYTNVVRLINSAVSSRDVRVYDLFKAVNDLAIHTINFAEATAVYNNALVVNLTMEGMVIDEAFPYGISTYSEDSYGSTFKRKFPVLDIKYEQQEVGAPYYQHWDVKSWAD